MGIEVHNGIELWRPALFDPRQILIAGTYYGMNGTSADPPGADVLIAQYFPVYRSATFDRIGCDVQTAGAAGAKARLGIYRDADLDGYPDVLVLDAGEVDCTTDGDKVITIDQHLKAGLYFVAVIHNDATTKMWYDKVPLTPNPLGIGTDIGYQAWLYRKTGVSYGVLPATFPLGADPYNDAWALAMRVGAVD